MKMVCNLVENSTKNKNEKMLKECLNTILF